MAQLDISGLNFFMPIFSFLFVFVIIYALLVKTKVLGGSGFVNVLISFIISIVFMSISSLELYVRTILPWFVVLVVIVFLILMLVGFSTGSLDKILKSKFSWIIVGLLVVVFLVSAIKVFNPILHPDLIITSAEQGSPGLMVQAREFFSSSSVMGSFLLLIIAGIVAWVLTKK